MVEERVEDTSLQSKLLKYPFDIQKLCGVYPHQKKSYTSYALFNILTHFIIMSLVVYMICCDLNNIAVIMSGIESFTSHVQGLMKYLPLLLHRNEMRLLIDDLPRFWRTQNADNYKFWIKLSRIYIMIIGGTLFIFMFYPDLLFAHHIPDFPHSFVVMVVIQKLQFLYSALVEIGTDLFYVSFCGIIKVQYQLLKSDLEALRVSEDKSRSLKSWIVEHLFIVKYTKCFARTFSEQLLLQYLVSTINLCSELYFFGQRGTDGLFLTIMYILALLLQTSIACLTAAEITNTAEEIVDALYSLEWYNFGLKEMKMLPLLIQEAQAPVRFVAGGLITIDQRTVTRILQNSYSFYALASQMKQQ